MAVAKNEPFDQEKSEVYITIPKVRGAREQEDYFVSLNGKNYLIQRGVPVKIPYALALVIKQSEEAEDYAIEYIRAKAQ